MLFMLLSLMGFHLWGESIHEWLGISFALIIFLHLVLNLHWFQQIFKGGYSGFRILQIAINIILMLCLLSAIVSGIMLSRHALPALWIHSTTDFVRKIHMTAVHWGQVIIAVHLGMHWKMLANFFCKIWRIDAGSFFSRRIMPLFFISTAVYGLYVFIYRELLPYLLVQVDFAFFDYEESKTIFYLDYFSVTILFSYVVRYLLWLFIFRKQSISRR